MIEREKERDQTDREGGKFSQAAHWERWANSTALMILQTILIRVNHKVLELLSKSDHVSGGHGQTEQVRRAAVGEREEGAEIFIPFSADSAIR